MIFQCQPMATHTGFIFEFWIFFSVDCLLDIVPVLELGLLLVWLFADDVLFLVSPGALGILGNVGVVVPFLIIENIESYSNREQICWGCCENSQLDFLIEMPPFLWSGLLWERISMDYVRFIQRCLVFLGRISGFSTKLVRRVMLWWSYHFLAWRKW